MQDLTEKIFIESSKIPDGLVERIQELAYRFNFPTDLIRNLLAMNIKEMLAEVLAVCCTHIAITGNMSSMDLATKSINTI